MKCRAFLLRSGSASAAALLVAMISALPQVHAAAPRPIQAVSLNSTPDSAPVGVIYDTDMWSDIDDALALAMLHAFQGRGEINLLAVTISTNDRWSAPYVSLVDRFYGHSQVPIGVVGEGGMDLEGFRKKFPQGNWLSIPYTQRLAEHTNEDGTWTYPRNLSEESLAPKAVALLRKTLAAQPDASVVMIQVGYSTNLARLLKSPPDALSPLDGRQLVAKKVRLLSMMAGNFGEAVFQGRTIPKGSPEFNILVDVPAAQVVFTSWPTPIVASGFEIGLVLQFPQESVTHDYHYVHNHPIEETYLTFCEELKPTQHWTCPHQQLTWDLTAVLYAVRPDRNYFSLSNPGKITVLDDGSSRFEEAQEGRDRYLILHEEQKARTLEAMALLASQPPANHTVP